MATPQGPTYDDYAACVPTANRDKLQQELDCESGDGVDLHLGELAHLLVDWELLAPKLGLSDVDVSDVHSDNKSAELERIDALKRSKSTLGFNATYGAYLKIFVENHKAKGALKCAEKIVMQLGATGGPSQSRSHAAQSTPSPLTQAQPSPLTQAQPSPPHSSPLSPPPSLQYTPPPSLQYSPPLSLPYTHNGGPQPSPYSSLPTSPPYNGHTSSGYNSNGSAVAPLAGTGANVGWATGHAQSHGMPPAPDVDSTTILGQAQLPAHSAVSNSPQVTQHTMQVTGRNAQPTKTALTIDDKSTLLRELSSVASLWEDFGLVLDLKQDQLDIINSDHGGCNAKLSAVLSTWLREGGERSWSKLCAALRSELMRRPVFADKLKKKHPV